MSWEEVEALPSGRTGGVFRGSAEPVVAQRNGATLRERVGLWWRSTPDHPSDRAARRIVLSSRYVYVERFDGTLGRVRLDQLHGERLHAKGLLLYGVRQAEDLMLPYRAGCEVQRHIASAVRGKTTEQPWCETHGLVGWVLLAAVLAALSAIVFVEYDPAEGWARIRENGMWTSESALGLYAGIGLIVLALLAFLWGPSRWRIDEVALTRTRGALPWMPFTLPPEAFRGTRITPSYHKTKNRPRYHSGWHVRLLLADKQRVGSLFKTQHVVLKYFSFGGARPAPDKQAAVSEAAQQLARRIEALLRIGEA